VKEGSGIPLSHSFSLVTDHWTLVTAAGRLCAACGLPASPETPPDEEMHTETLYLDAPEEAVVGTGAFDRVEIPLVSPQARLVSAMQNEDGILSRQARQIPRKT